MSTANPAARLWGASYIDVCAAAPISALARRRPADFPRHGERIGIGGRAPGLSRRPRAPWTKMFDIAAAPEMRETDDITVAQEKGAAGLRGLTDSAAQHADIGPAPVLGDWAGSELRADGCGTPDHVGRIVSRICRPVARLFGGPAASSSTTKWCASYEHWRGHSPLPPHCAEFRPQIDRSKPRQSSERSRPSIAGRRQGERDDRA